MNQILSLYKKEIHHLFDGILAYLCLCVFCFLLVASLYFFKISFSKQHHYNLCFSGRRLDFIFGSAFEYGKLDENRTGSIEILMTLPLRNEDIVISKYMSIVSVVFLALF